MLNRHKELLDWLLCSGNLASLDQCDPFAGGFAMYMQHNSSHERTEARWIVNAIIDAGHSVSVNDGEEWVCRRSTDADAILASMGSTDNDTLRVRDSGDAIVANFWLVYGNGPGELISDCSSNSFADTLGTAYMAKFPS